MTMKPEDFLDQKVQGANKTEHNTMPDGARADADIEVMFDKVMSDIHPGTEFEEFVTSLYDWYEEKGWLTEKQYDALEHAYNRS